MIIYHKSGARRYLTLHTMYSLGAIKFKYKLHIRSYLIVDDKNTFKINKKKEK